MGRLKIPLELIRDKKKRATTFQRRKEGIIKKAFELSSLCDVNVSMIIFDDHHHQNPEIFPSNLDKFTTLINLDKKFRSTDPKKIKSHEFLRNNKLEKAKKENLRAKYPTWHEFLNEYSEKSLREFASVLEDKTLKVKTRITSLKKTSKIGNPESYPPGTIIVLDDDDDVENPSPTKSTMITSNNMDDYNKFGLFTTGDQNRPDVVNSDSMMSEEDFNNLGIDIKELFGDKSSLESIMSEKEDDQQYWYDDENFGLQTDQFPEFEFCISPDEETMQQQPESSSCYMEMMPSLPSHVIDYITGSDYR